VTGAVAEAATFSVSLRRSGGILPGRVLESSVREEELEPGEAERVRALLDAADVPGLAARSPVAGPGADMYQYELEVERDDTKHCVRIAGSAVPEGLRPVVELLERRAVSTRPSRD
jgi:hypothetical protein